MMLPVSQCLSCGSELDASTGVYDAGLPKPGDITLCLYCGHIMAFAGDLGLRELTDSEARDVAGHPKILAAQAARQAVMKEKL